jgi:hypothetical protein
MDNQRLTVSQREMLRQVESTGRVASVITAELFPEEFDSIAKDIGMSRERLLCHVKRRGRSIDYIERCWCRRKA